MRKTWFALVVTILVLACSRSGNVRPDDFSAGISSAMINIAGMSCTGCEETITKGVTSLEGVQKASADYKLGKAWVTYDSTRVNSSQLIDVIEMKGYKVTGFIPYTADSTFVHLN